MMKKIYFASLKTDKIAVGDKSIIKSQPLISERKKFTSINSLSILTFYFCFVIISVCLKKPSSVLVWRTATRARFSTLFSKSKTQSPFFSFLKPCGLSLYPQNSHAIFWLPTITMTLLLRSFPLITLRTTIPSSLPLFQNLLRYHFPKSLQAKRTRALVTLSASSSSPETILKPQQQQTNDTLHWVSRTNFCGQLSTNDVGTRVRLCGWVALHRVHGGLTFLNLRDHTGIVQASPFILFMVSWEFDCVLLSEVLREWIWFLGFFSSFLFRLRLRLMNFLMRIRL